MVSLWLNAQSWSNLGVSLTGSGYNLLNSLNAIAIDGSGNLYAAGGNGYFYVAKWDGTKWFNLGGTVSGIGLNANNWIYCIATDGSGNVYAGGGFTDANGNQYVAKWDGTKWSKLGGTVTGTTLNANNYIMSIAIDAIGNLYAAGFFTDANGNKYVAKWDGTYWSELGGTGQGIGLNANGSITSLATDAKGNLYASGGFTDGNGKNYIAMWNGTTWSKLGGTVTGIGSSFRRIATDVSGNVYAAVDTTDANGKYYVAKWDGTKWSELGGTVTGTALNANNSILSIATDISGNVYAGGWFDGAVAKFGSHTTGLEALGAGLEPNYISAYPNPTTGSIYVKASEEGGVIDIYSPLGNLMVSKAIGNGVAEFPLGNLAPGVYTLIFHAKDGESYKPLKIVKE